MKVDAAIVTAERWHIPHIVAHVRDADRAEFQAATMQTPEEVLEEAYVISHLAWTGLIDGVPVCMFGVVDSSTVLTRQGRPWMVGTDLLEKHKMVFLRRCRACLEIMKLCFGRLENCVDARNTKAIQWLKWLGFSFGEPVPMGAFGLNFMRFSLEG